MGIISVTLPSDGTTADVADYNTPINTIVTAINGNLDSTNLADNAVSTSKLANANVTMPKITNPYKFMAYHNTTQTANASTATKLQFNTESYDTNSNFDNGTNAQYTIPVTGFYQFTAGCNITLSGVTDGFSLYVYKNGTSYIELPQTTAPSPAVGLNGTTPLLSCTAGDTFQIYVANATAGGKTVNGGSTPIFTYFSGFLHSI